MNREPTLNEEIGGALADFGEATSAPLNDEQAQRVWREAVRRSQAAEPARRWPAFAVACAAGAAVTLWLLWPSAPGFTVEPGAQVVASREQLQLTSGVLHAGRGREARPIVTPHLTVESYRGKVAVEVVSSHTVLSLEEGELTYRDREGVHRLAGPARVTVPTELLPGPHSVTPGCEQLPGAELDDCLEKAARGDGLAAQNALYERAMRAHDAGQRALAVQRFDEYQRRFPNGVLEPEASLGKMSDLRALGRLGEARREADLFLVRNAGQPRAAEVRAWRASLPDDFR